MSEPFNVRKPGKRVLTLSGRLATVGPEHNHTETKVQVTFDGGSTMNVKADRLQVIPNVRVYGTDMWRCPPELCGSKVIQAAMRGNRATFILEDGSVRGFDAKENGHLSPLDLSAILTSLDSRKVVQAIAGIGRTLLILKDGTIHVFDDNLKVLSLPDFRGLKVIQAALGVEHTVVLLEDGTVESFGDNALGQTALPNLGSTRVAHVAAGFNYTVLILESGMVRVFGCTTIGDQAIIPNFQGKKVVHVAAQIRYVAIILEDGIVHFLARRSSAIRCLDPNLCGRKVVQAVAHEDRDRAHSGGSAICVLDDGTVRYCYLNSYSTHFGYGNWNKLPDLCEGEKVMQAAVGGSCHIVLVLEQNDYILTLCLREDAVIVVNMVGMSIGQFVYSDELTIAHIRQSLQINIDRWVKLVSTEGVLLSEEVDAAILHPNINFQDLGTVVSKRRRIGYMRP